MFQRPFIVLALALSLAASVPSASAQDQPAAAASSSDKPQQPASPSPSAQSPAPDRDKPKAAAAKPYSGNSAGPGTTPVTSGPPAVAQDTPSPGAKPRRVITNEDIEGEHEQLASANSDIDIGNINDCDAACFEAVRGWANYYLVRNTDWKRDLLHGVDQVTEDGKWQSALYQIARSKSKFCDLNQDKNDAIADMADPRKMTEDEIAIDEAYDRKFEAAQSNLNTAYSQADAIMRTYSGIVVSFMNLQKQRAGNRVCVIRYPVMYRGYRVPLDDPDRP
ncbi:MAG TPA: hypothetical protein VN885_08805 [Candidatus Acidoferrales bacterium]|nr:hypothetical protein [Candidatus Acidoferrales bacterium]